ncbi:MAG: metal-sulfur cluster assembly factor [Propionibacteriaceae bacterium]|nr:metal-sulfur cluster assembly factor [Propionibacteriaceae bacterium]
MTETPRPSDLVKDTFPDAPGAPGAEQPAEVLGRPSIEDLEEAMRDVVDPELMVNVVDLGLVYGIHLDDENNATIDMTLTSPTCPLTDRIEYDTQAALGPLVNSATINWVWLPPWTLDNITDEGREQLRAVGYNL